MTNKNIFIALKYELPITRVVSDLNQIIYLYAPIRTGINVGNDQAK